MHGIRPSRPVLVAAAAVVVLVAGWSGWWWLAGQMLQRSLAVLVEDQRHQGAELRFGALVVDGFPWRLRATTDDVVVTLAGGLAWHGPGLVLEAPLWRVNALHLRLIGHHRIDLPTAPVPVTVSVDGGEGRLVLGGSAGFTDAELALSGLSAPPLATLAHVDVTASLPAGAVTGHLETGLMVTLVADGVVLAGGQSLPLGPAIESLAVTARVLGAPPRLDTDGLAAWSREGGTVELDTASLHWGPLALGAEGTLALDRDLQPNGAFVAEVAGFNEAIDALVAAGWVKPKSAQTAKAVLTGLAPPPEGMPAPANPTAKIPISIHDHFVHVGPFRLVPVPPLVWQRPAAG